MIDDVIELIKTKKWGKIVENVDLSKHTTYRVGGLARVMWYPDTTTRLAKIIQLLNEKKITYQVLGKGSNVIFSDQKYDGMIIKLDSFNQMVIKGNKVEVGAGYSLVKLSYQMAKHGFSGLEFASGIPGSVGGAIYMNAGAYKMDMGYIVSRVKVLTKEGKVITLANLEMDFHYRSSILMKKKDYIVISAVLRLKKGNKKEIEELMKDRKERRIATQPLEFPSAGSVFRNPINDHAGRLIEEAGLKGIKIGGAEISEKHANFIVNTGNATSNDIKNLIELVHKEIKNKYGIDLILEQEILDWK